MSSYSSQVLKMRFLQRIVLLLSWTYCAAQETCKRPEFRNARYEGNETVFHLNDKLEYECLDGYIRGEERSTTDFIVCGPDGWSHTPECHEIECDIPDLKPNIRAINGKDKFKVGDVLSFACQKNQKRVGPESIQCYHFGWSPDPPTCQEVVKSCGLLPRLANGKANLNTKKWSYLHGEVVEYECDAKFIMEGPKRIECSDGEWTSLPACIEVKKTCGDPPELNQGDLKSSHRPPYHHGDSVEYSCKEAFTMIGNKIVTCIQGTWTALPQCIGINQLKKCSVPPDPSNGKITSMKESDYGHNSFLLFICNANFEAEESTRIPCINGEWQRLPVCLSKERSKLCPPPPKIPHAQMISTSVRYMNGETLAVRCEDDYLLRGPEEIKCENGGWKFVPRCVPNGKCGPPPPIDNGDITSFLLREYPPGAQVEYKCQNLYKLEGSKQATCINGKWTNPPWCLEACTASPEDMLRNNIELRWSGSKKLYSKPGDVVEFSCKSGFKKAPESPPFRAQCLQGTIIYPKCINEACITSLEEMARNNIELRWSPSEVKYIEPGDAIEFTCKLGFKKAPGSPPFRAQCLQATVIYPTCIKEACITSPEDMARNNIEFRWSPSQIQYVEPGGVIEFACKLGFNKAPGSAPFRAQCLQTTLIYPNCVKEACTTSLEEMRRNNIEFKWSELKIQHIESGDVVEFTCKLGFTRAPESPAFRAQCLQGIVFYPKCIEGWRSKKE
ncbi:complement factor H-related protein 5-like [Tachyglossus aculeatus]|uniref:complement factor H-related protein 5-like n=1 Tax=Tachyglossus aculeatus TaxID=9261 RepID=UPI0018F3105F|nr:complement factor H-related protein 5-like [Tachyglossus aculeatus]